MLINYNMYWLLQKNVKEMMDVNGIKVLVDLLTLAHLHTTRAVVPFQVMCRFEQVIYIYIYFSSNKKSYFFLSC